MTEAQFTWLTSEVTFHTLPTVEHEARHQFRAGAAKVDITPPPGYSTLGFGPSARFTRGFWTRLWARTLYLEGATGARLALVSCDLAMMTGGLADRVLEILQAQKGPPSPLGRHEIIIAATHTHHGPGNSTSAYLYNFGGARENGVDPDLFEYLAQQIARSIYEAQEQAEEASLSYWTRWVPGVVRNRSYVAFRLNSDASDVLDAGRRHHLYRMSNLGGLIPPEAYFAVRPRLFVLDVRAKNEQRVIARTAFFPSHPTVLRADTELYASDFFGVAADVVERSLPRREGKPFPVVPIFNGAEGDVQPAWHHRDRREALQFGRRLARAIRSPSDVQSIDNPEIVWNASEERFADRCLPPGGGGRPEADPFERCTTPRPLTGVATIGGALDGYTVFNEAGWTEGVKGDRRNREEFSGQGVKHPALDPNFPLPIDLSITKRLIKKGDVAESAVMGVYRVGPLALVTLPGEFTTTMGWRIEKAVLSKLSPSGVSEVILVGLANEFISYVTTPEEYEAQRYEAASTLYGPYSGPVFQWRLEGLAKNLGFAEHKLQEERRSYITGRKRSFSITDAGQPPVRADDSLDHIVQDLRTRQPARNYPTACWIDKTWNLRDLRDDMRRGLLSAALPRVNPHVTVQTRRSQGIWKTVGTNDSLQVVTLASERREKHDVVWCATWLPPRRATWHQLGVRFIVRKLSGKKHKNGEMICLPPNGGGWMGNSAERLGGGDITCQEWNTHHRPSTSHKGPVQEHQEKKEEETETRDP